jgi:hypothetical protein
MIASADTYGLTQHICRVDGLNMYFMKDVVKSMMRYAMDGDYDCVKFPDDFPPQLTADIYKLSALRRLASSLPNDSPFTVHPKYAMFADNRYSTSYLKPERPSDAYLQEVRATYRNIYLDPRDEITNSSIRIGDTLSFHYELALPYLKENDFILDIACGDGFGAAMLARKCANVCAGDLSRDIIEEGKKNTVAFVIFNFIWRM